MKLPQASSIRCRQRLEKLHGCDDYNRRVPKGGILARR